MPDRARQASGATQGTRLGQSRLDPLIAGLSPSATLAINELSADLIAAGRDVIRLGLGQSPFPVPAPVVAALQRHAHEKAYLPVRGLPALRNAFAGYLQRTEGLSYDPGLVLVGPGTKELIFLLQLVHAGDLLVPSPSWVSYAPQAAIAGRRVHWLDTRFSQGLRLTAAVLEAHCENNPGRPGLLILNYPCNPTGVTYSAEQLQGIAEVARRFGVVVLSDEIYSGLDFGGHHQSIARYYPEGTIISNGLSKWCGAGGWRIGAFAFPEELDWLAQAMATVASETFTAVSAPIQHAAVPAFEGGDGLELYLDRSRCLLESLMGYAARRLRATGATVAEPQGGFYLFPRFSDASARLSGSARPATSGQLCRELLEQTGVASLPGSDFGRPPEELSLRLAAVHFDGEAALSAMAEFSIGTVPDDEFLRGYCQPTLRGLDLLSDWLDEH